MRPKHKATRDLLIVVVLLAGAAVFVFLGGMLDCGTIGPVC